MAGISLNATNCYGLFGPEDSWERWVELRSLASSHFGARCRQLQARRLIWKPYLLADQARRRTHKHCALPHIRVCRLQSREFVSQARQGRFSRSMIFSSSLVPAASYTRSRVVRSSLKRRLAAFNLMASLSEPNSGARVMAAAILVQVSTPKVSDDRHPLRIDYWPEHGIFKSLEDSTRAGHGAYYLMSRRNTYERGS